MKLKKLGHRAFKKTTLAALLLGSASAAQAAISVLVSYDADADLTTLSYSDNWEFYTPATLPAIDSVDPNGFVEDILVFNLTTPWSNSPTTLVFQATEETHSWPSWIEFASWDVGIGSDAFGFDLLEGGSVYAARDYTAGDPINGFMTRTGDVFDVTNLGTSYGGSYVYSDHPETVALTWTTTTVPEPASLALILGLGVLLPVATWRRKRFAGKN